MASKYPAYPKGVSSWIIINDAHYWKLHRDLEGIRIDGCGWDLSFCERI